jgi:hypothetical protein
MNEICCASLKRVKQVQPHDARQNEVSSKQRTRGHGRMTNCGEMQACCWVRLGQDTETLAV